jgi:cell division protein FtsN
MARVQAKKTTKKRKPIQKNKAKSHKKYWVFTFTGILLFSSGLYYLKSHPHAELQTHVAHNKKLNKHTHPTTEVAEKPRFDFYTMLPKMQVGANEEKVAGKDKTKLLANYLVQVASFAHYNQADKLKANLTLLGYDVVVKTENVHDKEMHRVLIGPFKNLSAATEAQADLKSHHLQGFLTRAVG